jgi:thioredoxin-like negative regulator of GroEL
MGYVQKISSLKSWDSKVLQSNLPVVLVGFYSSRSVPCRQVMAIVENLATEFWKVMRFAKVDVDKNSDIAEKYNVVSAPTLLIFKSGRKVGISVGARSTFELRRFVANHANKDDAYSCNLADDCSGTGADGADRA